MSSPTDLPQDELRALRARAYGPDADIQDDPVAMARLHELEAAARAAAPVVVPATTPSAWTDDEPADAEADVEPDRPAAARSASATDFLAAPSSAEVPAGVPAWTRGAADPDASATPNPASESAVGDAGSGIPDPSYPDALATAAAPVPRPWWRRRMPVLWVGSVTAALLLGVGLTLGVQALQSGRVAVLQVQTDAAWPDDFFGSRPPDSRIFEDFHGLTVLAFSQSFGGGTQQCLYALTSVDGSGFIGGSCGAGAFPPTASLEVVNVSPDELREAFPV